MAIQYKHGMEQVQALAQQAGKAQAAKVQLDMRFKKDMAMMDYQFKLAGEQRARAWDLEKMEIASRNDFSQQENARIQKQVLFESKIAQLDQYKDKVGGEKVEELKLKLRLEDLGLNTEMLPLNFGAPGPGAAGPGAVGQGGGQGQTPGATGLGAAQGGYEKLHNLDKDKADSLVQKFPDQFQIVGESNGQVVVKETPVQNMDTPMQGFAPEAVESVKKYATEFSEMAVRAGKYTFAGNVVEGLIDLADEQSDAIRNLITGHLVKGKPSDVGNIPFSPLFGGPMAAPQRQTNQNYSMDDYLYGTEGEKLAPGPKPPATLRQPVSEADLRYGTEGENQDYIGMKLQELELDLLERARKAKSDKEMDEIVSKAKKLIQGGGGSSKELINLVQRRDLLKSLGQ